MNAVDDFLLARQHFKEKYDFVTRISKIVGKQNVEPRRGWANVLLFRLSLIGTSMLRLTDTDNDSGPETHLEFYVLDHCSIAALGSALVEAAVMFAYLSDLNISEEEWRVRMDIIELHDLTARRRLTKHLDDMKIDEAEDDPELRGRKEELKSLVAASSVFRLVSDGKRQKDILDGKEVFLGGLRSVVREAGLDVNYFDAMWSMSSNPFPPQQLLSNRYASHREPHIESTSIISF